MLGMKCLPSVVYQASVETAFEVKRQKYVLLEHLLALIGLELTITGLQMKFPDVV